MKKIVIVKWMMGDDWRPSPDKEIREYRYVVPSWAEELPEDSEDPDKLTLTHIARRELVKDLYAVGIIRAKAVGYDFDVDVKK